MDSKLIPRYCSGVRRSVIEPFGIGLIIACRHIFGVNPVCKILLKKVVERETDCGHFKTSFGRLSDPTAFFNLDFVSTLLISMLVNSLFNTFVPETRFSNFFSSREYRYKMFY